MPLKKGTKAYREEYNYVHYGINIDTLAVEQVWETRDGTLSRGGYRHAVMRGRPIESELIIVFRLGDVRTLPVQMAIERGPSVMRELEAVADSRRTSKAPSEK